jgi:hypothetical protein
VTPDHPPAQRAGHPATPTPPTSPSRPPDSGPARPSGAHLTGKPGPARPLRHQRPPVPNRPAVLEHSKLRVHGRTVRAECLDWLLITGRGHLEQPLRVYVEHYNSHRPHRALGLVPAGSTRRPGRRPRPPAKQGASTRPARRASPRIPSTSCMNEFLHPTGLVTLCSTFVCANRRPTRWRSSTCYAAGGLYDPPSVSSGHGMHA